MTEQQNALTGAGLKPLNFQPFQADPKVTAYRALVKDDEVPGSPQYALTASIATPIFGMAKKDFITFLGEMRAAFTLLAQPDPPEGEPDTTGPPDLRTGIQLELSLVSISRPGRFGVAVAVLTSLGGKDSVGPRSNNHYWIARAKNSGIKKATVNPTLGQGEIWAPGVRAIYVDKDHPNHLKAHRVNVGSAQGMTYNLLGSFDGPCPPYC